MMTIMPMAMFCLSSCSDDPPPSANIFMDPHSAGKSQKEICKDIIHSINNISYIDSTNLWVLNRNLEKKFEEFYRTGGAKLAAIDKIELVSMAYSSGVDLGVKLSNYPIPDMDTALQINRLMTNLERLDSLLSN